MTRGSTPHRRQLPPSGRCDSGGADVPAETVHAVRNVGNGSAVELASYVVEKGKPFLVVTE
jgi:hypothetical protein